MLFRLMSRVLQSKLAHYRQAPGFAAALYTTAVNPGALLLSHVFSAGATLTGGALNFYEGGLTKRVLRIESESYFREGKE